MAEYEERFIVINKKRLVELNNFAPLYEDHPAVANLLKAIDIFKESYEADFGELLDQKYYVVNQDEPYADNIIKFILDQETKKEKGK